MSRNGFDRLARPYRWMEYLSFGRMLERCRFQFLPELGQVRSALLLGDGDGRFAERLLDVAADAGVLAVDGSGAMLQALEARCASGRVRTLHADLSHGLPVELQREGFDLVSTHFFLDCLTAEQVALLACDAVPRLQPAGRWIVSEFDVPRGPMRLPSAVLVRALYLCFRVMTGLRTQRLPDWRAALARQGMRCVERETFLAGLLVAECWMADGQ